MIPILLAAQGRAVLGYAAGWYQPNAVKERKCSYSASHCTTCVLISVPFRLRELGQLCHANCQLAVEA